MPDSPLARELLLGLAQTLGPLLDHKMTVHGVRLGDLLEQTDARGPGALLPLGQAIDHLVHEGCVALDTFPGRDPMSDPGTRVLLTERGLQAARSQEPTVGRPHPDQALRLSVDLGPEFTEGRLSSPRVTSCQPPALGLRMAEEPWILPVLLLLGLEPRWYLNVLAALLQFLHRQDRIGLGKASKGVTTAKGLGDRCAGLLPLLPALHLGKDRGQRTLGLIGALPGLDCSSAGAPVPTDTVHAVLRRAFHLGGIDPLARLPRSRRAGREVVDGDDSGTDGAPPDDADGREE